MADVRLLKRARCVTGGVIKGRKTGLVVERQSTGSGRLSMKNHGILLSSAASHSMVRFV